MTRTIPRGRHGADHQARPHCGTSSDEARVYVVAAEFDEAPPGSAGEPRVRPPVREGSFKVLVIGRPDVAPRR